MTPTRCQSCAVAERVTPVPRDPGVAPYNYEPFSDHTVAALPSFHLWPASLHAAHTRACQRRVSLPASQKRGLQRASSDVGWNLSEKPPETLYFGRPLSLMSTFPPRRRLSFPRLSPHRRPFALTVRCTSCLSLFDQPLIALYVFFPSSSPAVRDECHCLFFSSLPQFN